MGPPDRSHKQDVMPLRLLALLPLAEIAAFIVVGRAIGVLATLALVITSSAVGLVLLRDAGSLTLARLQRGIGSPEAVLAEGGSRILAGLLLIVPGFLSDLAGLALLLPGLRRRLARNLSPSQSRPPEPGQRPAQIIEGDFRRLDP
jgi:UPF0716 protein FxsA